jgi:hypothetical protein
MGPSYGILRSNLRDGYSLLLHASMANHVMRLHMGWILLVLRRESFPFQFCVQVVKGLNK